MSQSNEHEHELRLDGLGALRRSHECGDVRSDALGTEVCVAGWVHHRRDHGGVIFIDLRDASGVLQAVFKPDTAPEVHRRAHALRSEFVVALRGRVEARSPDTVNPNLATGEVEVLVEDARVENRVLTRGRRVQLAADAVEELGYLLRRIPLRPAEDQVLEKVCEAGLRGPLVARAGADPDAE